MDKNALPKLVVLDGNALSLLGMKIVLQRVAPQVEVYAFSTFEDMEAINTVPIAHYFVSSQMVVEHSPFFLQHRHQTIVLVNGTANNALSSQFHTLDTSGDEQRMVRNLLQLMSQAHSHGRNLPSEMNKAGDSVLSAREIEVLTLIVKGFLNKEIADQLCISLTTVISHRKNIMDKLGIRNVSGLTIYAVVNGYVEACDI